MATEATFTIPSGKFPLGSVFEGLSGVTVTLERIIPGADVVIPYFWVQGTEVDDIEAEFDDHEGLKAIHLVDSVENQYLMRVEWAADYDGVLSSLQDTGVPLIQAEGTDDKWTFDIRGDHHRDIAAFQRRCREIGIPMTLTALHTLTPLESDTEHALTDSQEQALALAYERGYYDSPRQVTMSDLGADLGISQQAVASRLRRGIKHILGRTLTRTDTSDI